MQKNVENNGTEEIGLVTPTQAITGAITIAPESKDSLIDITGNRFSLPWGQKSVI